MVESLNMNEIVKSMNILFITLDSLRFDVADDAFKNNLLPNCKNYFPDGWQKCHTSGSFTYAAHQAFFAGFLPTPATPTKTARLFAAHFIGSETTTENTLVFQTPDIVTGFAQIGFKTVCIGGVGFFNKQTQLGNVLPSMFQQSYWQTEFSVTEKKSTAFQFHKAIEVIEQTKDEQQLFLFINVSAIHQPNWFYLYDEKQQDTIASHSAALQYVDAQLPNLIKSLKQKRDTFCIICSDHGTAYGEDDYFGHRIAHPTVWNVPLATFIVKHEK